MELDLLPLLLADGLSLLPPDLPLLSLVGGGRRKVGGRGREGGGRKEGGRKARERLNRRRAEAASRIGKELDRW